MCSLRLSILLKFIPQKRQVLDIETNFGSRKSDLFFPCVSSSCLFRLFFRVNVALHSSQLKAFLAGSFYIVQKRFIHISFYPHYLYTEIHFWTSKFSAVYSCIRLYMAVFSVYCSILYVSIKCQEFVHVTSASIRQQEIEILILTNK